MTSRVSGFEGIDWRAPLRARLLWLLVAKALGLWLLWYVCFSAAHRKAIDADVAAASLALPPAHAASATAPPLPSKNTGEKW